jgi:DNA-binding response OmpR family regulator
MFAGAKILVVEDNYLLAEVVCDFVIDCGMHPIGPATSLDRGLAYAEETPLDGAILDINLGGRLSFPICSVLLRRNIPFCFLTACGDLSLVPQQFRGVPLVLKPFEPDEMRDAIETMLRGQLDGPLARAASSTGSVPAASS